MVGWFGNETTDKVWSELNSNLTVFCIIYMRTHHDQDAPW